MSDTQLPSTKLPLITVETTHVRQATYKAHANQCKLSPYKNKKNNHLTYNKIVLSNMFIMK